MFINTWRASTVSEELWCPIPSVMQIAIPKSSIDAFDNFRKWLKCELNGQNSKHTNGALLVSENNEHGVMWFLWNISLVAIVVP